MIIYIDSNYMCHTEYKESYIEAEHPFFDTICPLGIECYKFIPERDFIQCVDSKSADAYQKQYDLMKDDYINGYDQSTLDALESEVV